MENKSKKIAVIGGGAAGLFASLFLAEENAGEILLFERNERLGRKLSATGNGQGNITNTDMGTHKYFSSDRDKVGKVLEAFGRDRLIHFLVSLGGWFVSDEEGRVYPASKQAASVTDILRFAIAQRGVCVHAGEFVRSVKRRDAAFRIETDKGAYDADFVVAAAGGKASPHFGADGNGYTLAKLFGHSITPLSPALVQLKTEKEKIKGLKGIRAECSVKLLRDSKEVFACRGDVIFTDYGVSGNAVFRASSYAREKDVLSIDFLPDCKEEELKSVLKKKSRTFSSLPAENLLRCIVHSAIASAALRNLEISSSQPCGEIQDKISEITAQIKDFRLTVSGSMGFENAQVTKGGIPLSEVDEYLMSRLVPNLFFAGEILDVDGECGGYNLQWAFSSGVRCARRIAQLCREG